MTATRRAGFVRTGAAQSLCGHADDSAYSDEESTAESASTLPTAELRSAPLGPGQRARPRVANATATTVECEEVQDWSSPGFVDFLIYPRSDGVGFLESAGRYGDSDAPQVPAGDASSGDRAGSVWDARQ